MNKEIGDYIHRYMPHAHGWCTPEKAESLAVWVLENKPSVCVEIGVFAGRSLVAMALACKDNSLGMVYGIDPWSPDASAQGFDDANRDWWLMLDHTEIYHHCNAMIKIFGVEAFTTLIRADSRHAFGKLPGGPIDLLHIDGNHSEESSVFDVETYVPRVRRGGAVWFDDIDWQTTKRAQTLLLRYCDEVGKVGTCAILRKK